jgi:signal transduction histidine kinase
MRRDAYFRILIVSVVAALVLSAFSLLCLIRLSDYAAAGHRGDFIRFLASSVEREISGYSVAELRELGKNPEFLDRLNFPPPGPPSGPPPQDNLPPGGIGHDGPPRMDGRRPHRLGGFGGPGGFGAGPGGPPHADVWLMSDDGGILAGRSGYPLPISWTEINKPLAVHDVVSKQDFLRISPGIFVIKLDREPATYLVFKDNFRPFLGPLFLTQAVLTFATVAAAVFFSLSLTFFYLRRKSQEARAVLLRLEQGDLKARFEIQRFDEFGGLLLDFNRMAQEIERLVSRVRSVETARKNLLQELGHDLRTPLTSLITSFEMLKTHFDKMSNLDRDEIFQVLSGEVEYFKDLLEKLMTIASLDEPHYKKSAERIDLTELLGQELKLRQNSSENKLTWRLVSSGEEKKQIFGDPHLVLRLFRNGLDNAARFAKSTVEVTILLRDGRVETQIADDGPGLSESMLASFGKRREQRTLREGSGVNYSLGLGSVIMKTIAELHDGQIKMENIISGGDLRGAQLTIVLPSFNEAES